MNLEIVYLKQSKQIYIYTEIIEIISHDINWRMHTHVHTIIYICK